MRVTEKRSVAAAEVSLDPRRGPQAFIRANLRLQPVVMIPEIRLYAAHAASGLRQLGGDDDDDESDPPYWAYAWAGGAALARYILDRPELVEGRRALDLGAGSGLVAIAAAKAGASEVIAAEVDAMGIAALGLNAAANGLELTPLHGDLLDGPPPLVDVVMVGDLFYEAELAERVTAFLDGCLDAGMRVLVGDPGRPFLPWPRLRRLAEFPVPDFGKGGTAALVQGAVFAFEPA